MRDSVHGTREEQADGLVDMRLVGDRGQGEFGQTLRDADDGLELADGDGDAALHVGAVLVARSLRADRDKVAAELLGGLAAEARRAPALAEGDVALELVDGDVGRGLLVGGHGGGAVAHVDAHDVAGDGLVALLVVVVAHDEDHVET